MAMRSSNAPLRRSSSKDFSEETFRQMKREFRNWVISNNETTMSTEATSMDIDDYAKLFQAQNFQIRQVDTDLASLAKHSGGIQVTITCLKSANRIVLQKEDNKCVCRDSEVDGGSQWEVMATSNSLQRLVETGSKNHPPLKSEKAAMVRLLMNYMKHITTGNFSPIIHNEGYYRRSEGMSNSRGSVDNMPRLSLDSNVDNTASNLLNVSSRYRSLDTLINQDATGRSNKDLPMPGALQKPTYSSEKTIVETPKTSVSPMSRSPLPVALEKYLNIAQEQINKAVSLIKSNKRLLSEKKEVTQPKTSSLRVPKTTSSIRTAPKPQIVAPAKTTITSTSAKRLSKYAHVKSTIPKPSGK